MTNTTQKMNSAFKVIRQAQFMTDQQFFGLCERMDPQAYLNVMNEFQATQDEMTKQGYRGLDGDLDNAYLPEDLMKRYLTVQDKKLGMMLKHMDAGKVMKIFLAAGINEEMVLMLEDLGARHYAEIFKGILEKFSFSRRPPHCGQSFVLINAHG